MAHEDPAGAPEERKKSGFAAVFLTAITGALAIVVAIGDLPAIRHGEGKRQIVGFVVIYAVITFVAWVGYLARKDSVVSTRVAAGFTAIVSIAAFVAAFSFHATSAKSQRVQSQGIHSTATVLNVDYVKHAGFRSIWYSELVTVKLHNGRTSVVHNPNNPPLAIGRKLSVVTDPQNTSYSEIRGLPLESSYTWFIALLISLTAGAFSAAFVAQLVEVRRRKAAAVSAPAHSAEATA